MLHKLLEPSSVVVLVPAVKASMMYGIHITRLLFLKKIEYLINEYITQCYKYGVNGKLYNIVFQSIV